jgi:hypothetical protein
MDKDTFEIIKPQFPNYLKNRDMVVIYALDN